MKKLFILSLTCISVHLFGLQVGNPALPGIIGKGLFLSEENWIGVRTGYQHDTVSDRRMKAVSQIPGRFTSFRYSMDQGLIVINLINRFDLYGSFGAMKITAANNPRSNLRTEFETHDQFTWGVGARALVFTWNDTSFGIDGKYQHAHPRLRWLGDNGRTTQDPDSSKIEYREWQVSVGISQAIDIFTPYIAVKYSNASAHFDNLPLAFLHTTRNFNAKNRKKFGMAIGCTLSSGRIFELSVEARVIDEQALSFSGEMKF